MAVKDCTPTDVQVIREALKYMRKSLERNRSAAKMENIREALRKDIEALDSVLGKV